MSNLLFVVKLSLYYHLLGEHPHMYNFSHSQLRGLFSNNLIIIMLWTGVVHKIPTLKSEIGAKLEEDLLVWSLQQKFVWNSFCILVEPRNSETVG
jgi:hypothetical protein